MTQLTYHPAFDPYNQIFRTIRLLVEMRGPFDGDKLRIADFYLLFPEKIPEIRLSRALRSMVGGLNIEPRFPYDLSPNSRILFARMEHTFQAAIQTMLHYALLDPKVTKNNLLAMGEGLPEDSPLVERARQANAAEKPLIAFLSTLIREFPYSGPDGLKDRTQLEEHRYDAA